MACAAALAGRGFQVELFEARRKLGGRAGSYIDRATGEIRYGRVPPYSVVVPGVLPHAPDRPALACAVIVKQVDERTRAKTSINELLRD